MKNTTASIALAVTGLLGLASAQGLGYIPNCAYPVLMGTIEQYISSCTEANDLICFCKDPVTQWYWIQNTSTGCPNETDAEAAVAFGTQICVELGIPINFPVPDPNATPSSSSAPSTAPEPPSSSEPPASTSGPDTTEPPVSSAEPSMTAEPSSSVEPSGSSSPSSSDVEPSSSVVEPSGSTSAEPTTIITSTRPPTASSTSCTKTKTATQGPGNNDDDDEDCTCEDGKDSEPSGTGGNSGPTGSGSTPGKPSAPVTVNMAMSNSPSALFIAGIVAAAAGLL
ncbi:hypothetical protein SAPIO_CDS4707 [Scedosporium apiospermum]|uniref:CFEM domain-containing protein n=1 Tax=Pseudallescheria apiosperma TaxID=563466 RepID=A0A084G7F9_PSEDA|nr:uncharacterized protein SAPIO_CDS4707 [Scedosporium apiospermum]KEZ43271.1 hypothetical protein SAPIO_CDS4707 [Scedosporium apiospermum]